jgi:tripartite-type tricarboxylate transporter receptor subunit TctC
MSDGLGHQVVVENRGGASGIVGVDVATKSAPDGYTLVLTQASLAINPSMFRKMPYDAIRDLAAICELVRSGSVLVVHPSVPVKTVRELIALARAQPGRLVAGSPGLGTQPHLGAELFKLMAKVDIPQVAYKGASHAALSLLTGEISVQFASPATMSPYLRTGRVRPLAVTTATRMLSLPELPTIAEAALPGFESSQWYGILTRAGTPRPIIDRLNQEANRVLGLPDMKQRLQALDMEVRGGTPDEFATRIKLETERYAKIIKAAGIKPE